MAAGLMARLLYFDCGRLCETTRRTCQRPASPREGGGEEGAAQGGPQYVNLWRWAWMTPLASVKWTSRCILARRTYPLNRCSQILIGMYELCKWGRQWTFMSVDRTNCCFAIYFFHVSDGIWSVKMLRSEHSWCVARRSHGLPIGTNSTCTMASTKAMKGGRCYRS